MDNASAVESFDPPGICALCHRILPLETDTIDLESISICGDCKFLFLEDGDTQSQHIQRRTPRVRRTRYTNSSESIDNIFSHQFSNMINQSRHSHNPPVISDIDNQSIDSVLTSSRTTPTGSRRYRRVLSDTESEGFDSVYGESDAISYGVYGGDSDASVDVHSFLGDSDTDIDPMHAGLNQWSSEDEWEEIEDSENNNNTLGNLIARVHLQRSLESDNENAVHIRISERRRQREGNVITTPFGNIMEQGHSGDYLDARSFEELVERLAEADNSRRGAPPASVSFVENLEKVVVNKDEFDGVGCAICKESFCVGGVVNRLPCLHVYHGGCIKPWLSSRNSCPLCRYELPTDDMEYENRKERVREMEREVEEEEEEEEGVDMSFHGLDVLNEESGNGSGSGRGRGRWFFVVSLVGIGLALWLGNPRSIQGTVSGSGSGSHGQRGNRSRRWWSLF